MLTLIGSSSGLSQVDTSDRADHHSHHRGEEEIDAEQGLGLGRLEENLEACPEAYLEVEMACLLVEIRPVQGFHWVGMVAYQEVRTLVESLLVARENPGVKVACLVRPSWVVENLEALGAFPVALRLPYPAWVGNLVACHLGEGRERFQEHQSSVPVHSA